MSIRRVYPNGKYHNNYDDLVINWGSTIMPSWRVNKILNHPDKVKNSVNKISTFKLLQSSGIQTVEWTESRDTAYEWLYYDNVVERHLVSSYGGKGIRIVMGGEDNEDNTLELCPLYTKFIPKAREYRLHVFKDNVFDIQQKRRRNGGNQDGLIKNFDNGWVYCRDDITTPPDTIYDIAKKSIAVLGLDFGAVDILVKEDKCYVCEVNCAVGLEGSTLLKYVNQFKNYA